jgi:radical SAM protein with 4Fe4S-binding SPASM domain
VNLFDATIKKLMYVAGMRVKNKHLQAFLRYNSFERLANLLRVELAIRRGRTHDFGYPYILAVEPTNVCNVSCPLCPTGRGLSGRTKQTLDFENYKRVIDEVGKYVYLVNLQNWGEPLLAPAVVDMIRYSHEKRIFTTLSTNANYAPRLNEQLVDAHLDHITFAIDGATQEVYEKYRVGGRLDRALGNLRGLLDARKKRGVKHPFVELQFLVFDHNRHEVPAIEKLAREYGVDGLLVRAANGPENERNRRSFYTWDNKKGFCSRFWYTATVSSDGGLTPCCNYFDGRDDFGNVFSTGFEKAWNDDTYRRNRENVAKRNVAELTDICKSCKVYDPNQASYPIYTEDASRPSTRNLPLAKN